MRKLLAAWFAFSMLMGLMVPLPGALANDLAGEGSNGVDQLAWQNGEVVRYAEVVTPKGTLNMRATAKDDAEILARLPKGTIVRIIEEDGDWIRILHRGKTGHVKASFLHEITQLPYAAITKEDQGNTVSAFKRALYQLGYLKSDDVNQRFDAALETALTKLQLMNNLPLNPTFVTPELQALMEWGMVVKGKTGYLDTAVEESSGLSVSIYCWDSAGMLYEADQSVKLEISYAVQATGGRPPYAITVKKSLGGEASGDEVSNPFSHIWSQSTERLYVYATVVDAAGNTVTACAPFRYSIPERYQGLG